MRDEAFAFLRAERHFEAHELFEFLWSDPATAPAERPGWKGLAQVAVGYCHIQRGNAAGAVALLERGARTLEGCASPLAGIDLRRVAEQARTLAGEVRSQGLEGRRFPDWTIVLEP
ncbi:MAG TPA: DUF309 domain-containing protein [Candidatus Polarisedimenticolaceae bacterium]|nr:DUF309 domain-containing protein [Candidatus Polarisedimenticolaceae bacterium]